MPSINTTETRLKRFWKLSKKPGGNYNEMALCNICREIPWENLPTVPPESWPSSSGYPYLQDFHHWPEDSRGYPHHQGLEALRNAAANESCGICSLILTQVELCQAELEELKPKWEAGTITKYGWPLWEMWFVKRQVGGDGFWVMSTTDDTNKRNHPKCSPGDKLLPYRVVDMGDDINSPYAKLRETDGQEFGKYISLSYCWGKEPQFTTTKATIKERKRQITISDLSQTHQDVIKLARELGVRYLWIDSICICQGDYDDWERESAKMLSIYANSYLTVAASKAKDHSEGLFSETTPREYKTFEYKSGELSGKAMAFNLPINKESGADSYVSLPDEPLSDRGWALQERVLPYRTLLYTKQQMFFECSEGFRGEDGTVLDWRFENVHDMPNGLDEKKEPGDKEGEDEDPKESLYQSWYSLLWIYGPRKLTEASDKLPDISGLASIFAQRLNDEYVVGLWRSKLLEGLLWQSLRCRRVAEYRAPSWSWASMDGIPGLGVRAPYEEVAKILDVDVDLKGTNIYGEVTSGKLQIQAPLERLYLDVKDWDPTKPGFAYDNNPPIRTAHDETHSRFDFDFTADDAPQEALKIVESLEGKEFFALILLKVKEPDEETYHAVIVKRVDGGEEYERLGFGFIDEKALGFCSNEETSTITEATQVSSLAASCPTYTGDLQLTNITKTINMTGVETLIGDITYNNDFPDDYVTFYSSTLKNVTGDLLMYGAGGKMTRTPGDLNITLPALRTIYRFATYGGWGDVSINTYPKLNISQGLEISSGASQSAAGNLYLNVSSTYSIGVLGVDFQATGGALFTSSAEKVKREITIWGNSGLERVVLDNLKFVNYTVDIRSNPDLDYISLSLPEVGLLRVKENGRDTHLSVPNLKKLGGRSDPSTHTSGGDAGGIFRDLVNASLPSLTEVHGDDVDWFKGKLNFTSNFFSELSLPSLKTANCTLGIDENIALNDFSVPRLNYVKDLQIHDNPRLLNFTANLLKKADNINMTGSFTNVEFFSLELITGDFYLAGDKTMDCSWFDENFLNHIVQGSYKCVGNHTKPAIERKPSTPTDEADLEDGDSKQGESSSSGSGESSSSGSNGGLSTGAKAGIGAGVGVAGLVLLGLGAGFLIGKKAKKPPGAVTHTTESGYQKAELDGDGKASSGVKQVHSVEASEMQDTGKSELPLNPARAELAG
ncbi:hypothetical protein FBULB1_13818 [Fusarium bulbicola]|nr:hypothetical protein FBULB1_13818 [Fusarium bulbicola]